MCDVRSSMCADARCRSPRAAGFSKTARSRPGHREAGRHGGDVGRGRGRRVGDSPTIVAERAAERAEAAEADVEADVGDAAVGLAQQEHRPLDPPALQVAVRRLAEGRPEGADEVRLGDVRDPRQRRDVERLARSRGPSRRARAAAAGWCPRRQTSPAHCRATTRRRAELAAVAASSSRATASASACRAACAISPNARHRRGIRAGDGSR